MAVEIKSPKKLIEVALPLDRINDAAAREKSIRHGHPSTLHLWWARRPLAAARAVIFAQMVNDPSWKWEMEHPGEVPPNNLKATWANSRKRLFGIIEQLVTWENTNNEEVLDRARTEIRKSWLETCELNRSHSDAEILFNPSKLPGLHDPFAGGGGIPLEAQRLGLEAYASDLNPVAVLINKAMIEIPPKFSGRAPINPSSRGERTLTPHQWDGSQGLAEDIRYYGQWVSQEAERRIGYLYPKVEITPAMAAARPDLKPLVGQKLTVIAWLWARTVKSPNPAFHHVDVPLTSTFVLSSKAGKEAYVEPCIEGGNYRFLVKTDKNFAHAKNGTKLSRGANFRCLLSDTPIEPTYIKAEGRAGRMGARLLAMVADGPKGRVYLDPQPEMESLAKSAAPQWVPDTPLPNDPRNFWTVDYGLTTFGDLFTPRQLVALTTLADLIADVRSIANRDAISAGMIDDELGLDAGGTNSKAYADAISVYLAFSISRVANVGSTVTSWMNDRGAFRETFARQAIPMVWDYAESNPFADTGGSLRTALDKGAMAIHALPAKPSAFAIQADAATQKISSGKIISTDPPYYDNIGYADLSDYFYVWLRRSLQSVIPSLFSTIAVPKIGELVATPYRHGGKAQAEAFFLGGMTNAMMSLADQSHPAFPISIYYAFKQSESDAQDGTGSTGWETFLEAVIRANLSISGTWPMKTEGSGRIIATGNNALASSIILVCRPRSQQAQTISRRMFIRELNAALPEALDEMTRGSGEESSPVAPVDLSQAIIGPGMAIYSKYSAVLEADGSPMNVRTALRLINRFLAEDDFDPDTQFCLHWFEEHGWTEGPFGDADQLARSKGTAVNGIQQAGVINAAGGKVTLLRPSDYPADWNPMTDTRLPVWEVLHQLIRLLRSGGYEGAAAVISGVASKADAARQLAYRLYTLCERAGWSDDARSYNEIITSWPAIEEAALRAPKPRQTNLFDA